MITIDIKRNDDNTTAVHCGGHAGYCSGNDIVCAGVSAVVQAFVGTMINSDIATDYKMDCGYCKVIVGEGADRELKMLIIGLLQIQKAYPKNIILTYNFEI